jgi:uncharacterized protein YkuJ
LSLSKTKSEDSTSQDFGIYLSAFAKNMDKWLVLDAFNMETNQNNLLFTLQNLEKPEAYEFENIEWILFDLARLSYNTTNVQVR